MVAKLALRMNLNGVFLLSFGLTDAAAAAAAFVSFVSLRLSILCVNESYSLLNLRVRKNYWSVQVFYRRV